MRDPDYLVAVHFRGSCEVLERAANDMRLRTAIHDIADTITRAFRNGCKLMIAGNGGSAADAQHIAREFRSRLNFERNPLPAIVLTADTSVLTAIGNDYDFDRVFERQIRGLGRAGDVFLAISTSGRSPNVRQRSSLLAITTRYMRNMTNGRAWTAGAASRRCNGFIDHAPHHVRWLWHAFMARFAREVTKAVFAAVWSVIEISRHVA